MAFTTSQSADSNTKNTDSNFVSIPPDRPWLLSYERYNISPHIRIPDHQTSLLEMFERNFQRYADQDALIFKDTTISYCQLDQYSRQIAAYLQSLELKMGDKVAVMMPNILQYPIIILGILRAGMILVNINPLYTPYELEFQLKDSGAKALFVVENFAKTYQNIDDKCKVDHVVVCHIGDMMGFVKGPIINGVVRYYKGMVPSYKLKDSVSFKQALNKVPASDYKRPNLNLSNVALLQYTGGTTGVARGAMLTHGNLIANVLQIDTIIRAAFQDTFEGDTILTALPLYHIFSFTVCGIYGMYAGFKSLLILDPKDINSIVNEIDKNKPAFIPSVNTLFKGLVNNKNFQKLDFSNLKASIGGGMSVSPSVATAWQEITGLPIIEGYGLSETSPVVSFNPMNVSKHTGKIGIPAPDTDVILIDDLGKTVPVGERGEICVKGPQVMINYQNHATQSETSFTTAGYFKTGDIGIMDSKGFIKIVDRKKDMILVSGFNVYPNEIEEIMIAHPAVQEVGAIGVPNEDRGEEPKIFVVKVPNSEVTELELIDYGKRHLTGYKRPRQVQFIEELPKSNVGKVLRKDLRKMQGLE